MSLLKREGKNLVGPGFPALMINLELLELLNESHHLAAGIKEKTMTTLFLPLCKPLDGNSDLTVSLGIVKVKPINLK